MKTPDKIYIPNGKEAVQNGLYKTWFDTDEYDMPYVEYIRKEVLLEYLHHKKCNSVDREVRKTFEEVIEKVNSI